ncbi:hypothetical protein COY17_01345 [Candidatus Saccharibacteria bacterium CG_4_10_14_0_2_um_filter_52_9]|nr:MAG: hypothetical protein COY17_01345 [Candidatus Saccharibacteria bacterium CG_4_10_14_0_2_um_filter_52_9]
MGTQERQEVLREMVPGKLVTDIHFSAGSLAIHGLREGIVPDSSPLAAPDIRTFVATNSGTFDKDGELAILLEGIHDGEAMLGLEARVKGVDHNVHYLREVVRQSMRKCDVRLSTLDPQTASVPVEVLEQVGFHEIDSESGLMQFVA